MNELNIKYQCNLKSGAKIKASGQPKLDKRRETKRAQKALQGQEVTKSRHGPVTEPGTFFSSNKWSFLDFNTKDFYNYLKILSKKINI